MPTKPHVKATQTKTDTAQHSSHSVPQRIEPLEGWTVQTSYGTLKTARGINLVRLEDVHTWLMRNKGIPSSSASALVFSVFISDAGSSVGMRDGAESVRKALCILDPTEYACEYGDFASRLFFKEVNEIFPFVPHHRFDKGTIEALIYSIGIVSGQVWASSLSEIQNVDLNDRLDGYCTEGDFPSLPKCRSILGRFAVSFRAAHELWGWGSVAVDAHLRSEDAPHSDIQQQTPTPKPIQRSRAQEQAILDEIKRLDIDPKRIPKNKQGKSGVKKQVRDALKNHELFVGTTIFDKAWVRLSESADIIIVA